MQASHVYDKLGENLARWQNLVQSVRKSRTTFDTAEKDKRFGPVVISYERVRATRTLEPIHNSFREQ